VKIDLSEAEAELTEKFRALSTVSKNTILTSVRLAVMEGQEREQAVRRESRLEPPAGRSA
jgi:hypothetical protein